MIDILTLIVYSISGLSAAAIFSLIWITRVPDHLKHIPSVPLWPSIFKLAMGMPMIDLMEYWMPYFEKYGVIRYFFAGQWKVMTGDPELLKKIAYDHKSFDKLTAHEVIPGTLADNVFGTNIVFSNHSTWKRHRKIINSAFKKGWNLNVFSEIVDELFQKMGDTSINKVDVEDLMQRVTVEALGREVMDVKFDGILSKIKHRFASNFYDIMNAALNPLYFVFPMLDQTWNPLRFKYYKKLEYVNDFLDKLLEQRRKQILESKRTKLNDILSLMLLSNESDSDPLTNQEIKYDTLMFFLAGQDTTSFSMCAALHLLAEHPEIQDKVRSEVLMVLGKEEYINDKIQTPTQTQLDQLKYTHAVIKETMRLYPAVSILYNWIVKEDHNYNGMVVPKNSIIDTYIYAIHRNPKYFKNPSEFDPSRFLSDNGEESKADNFWFGFSTGARMCLGSSFSITEQKIVLSYMLRRYIIKPSGSLPSQKRLKTRIPFLLRTDNLRLDFERI